MIIGCHVYFVVFVVVVIWIDRWREDVIQKRRGESNFVFWLFCFWFCFGVGVSLGGHASKGGLQDVGIKLGS